MSSKGTRVTYHVTSSEFRIQGTHLDSDDRLSQKDDWKSQKSGWFWKVGVVDWRKERDEEVVDMKCSDIIQGECHMRKSSTSKTPPPPPPTPKSLIEKKRKVKRFKGKYEKKDLKFFLGGCGGQIIVSWVLIDPEGTPWSVKMFGIRPRIRPTKEVVILHRRRAVEVSFRI